MNQTDGIPQDDLQHPPQTQTARYNRTHTIRL